MNNATDIASLTGSQLRLARSLGIRDAAGLKQRLLELLEAAAPVVIDITDVERVDTAALQLLFAFNRDRAARGGEVQWQGDSAAFHDGVKTLGLSLGQSRGVAHGT
jgi:anti-anti-sigma regulatory factor